MDESCFFSFLLKIEFQDKCCEHGMIFNTFSADLNACHAHVGENRLPKSIMLS